MLQCLRILQAQGVAVVMETDDLLSAVAFGTPGHDALVRKGLAARAAEAAREADWVTATSPALVGEYARHGRGSVVPNAVPRRIAELAPAYERVVEPVTIGWSGSVYGHPYDLQELGSGLEQALAATTGRSRFLVLGQKGDMRTRLGMAEEPEEVLWKPDVDTHLAAVGELFDIGIAPLRIDRSNTAKSWLEVLEYSARGVCSVRSPSAEYERLGIGWRARSARDRAQGLTKAVQDPVWRREQARAAHQQVLDRHLTEHTVPLWVAAWERAAEHRAAQGRRRSTASV